MRSRFGVSPLPNLVLAAGNEECLLGTTVALLDRRANLISQLVGRVPRIAGKTTFMHAIPLSRAVPQWHHFPSEVVPSKAQEIEEGKSEKHHKVAPTLYVPIPMSFADDPAALHARHSYWCLKVSTAVDSCRLVATLVESRRLLSIPVDSW